MKAMFSFTALLASVLTAAGAATTINVQEAPGLVATTFAEPPENSLVHDDSEPNLVSRQVAPTINFCSGLNCASCTRLSLVDRPFGVCQSPIPNPYSSFFIDNPSRTFLPYTIFVGSCSAGIQVPNTNQCFNLNGVTGTGWFRQNSGGGTF